MEKRTGRVMMHAPGGTAAKGSHTYKLSIPSPWAKEMGITEDDRDVELSFDGRTISISKKLSIDEFISKNKESYHTLYLFHYYSEQTLCSKIIADYADKKLCFENYVDSFIHTAFGNNLTPTWTDFETFLEERCIPRSRAGLREYLETIGVDKYDPLEIIKKTGGRMAEDNQWIEVEEIK